MQIAVAAPLIRRGFAAALLFHATVLSASAQEVSPEKRQFLNACGTCHAAEPSAPHRQGPNLFGIMGKPAASLDGFKYSDALKASGLTWDEATLDKWLTDAQAAQPGTTMLYRQANPERRQLVISYLKSLK
jgi:cytochrome c